jgi:tetratricopeptide (TPR) repeat protein
VHAQTSGDALEIAAAHWALGQGAFHRGDLHGAERAFELALSGFARVGHGAQVSYLGVDYQVFTLCYLSHVQWCLGKVESAVATSKAASALTTDIAHDYSSALALAYAATLNLLLGDVPSANASVEPLLQLCGRKGFTYYLGWGRFVRGWAAAEGTAGTSEEMRDGLAIMRASGARLRLAFYQASLAERYVLEDRKDEAEAAVSSALDELERTRERCWEPEVMRVLAVVSSAASCAGAPTESYLRQALSTARSQDALSWELRVALSLARLLADTGRGVEARDLLVGVYRRCREGFEMPPLREAAELIDSLC